MVFDISHVPSLMIQPDAETIFQILAQYIPTSKLTAWEIPAPKFTLYFVMIYVFIHTHILNALV